MVGFEHQQHPSLGREQHEIDVEPPRDDWSCRCAGCAGGRATADAVEPVGKAGDDLIGAVGVAGAPGIDKVADRLK
jgi:hypothetical protein